MRQERPGHQARRRAATLQTLPPAPHRELLDLRPSKTLPLRRDGHPPMRTLLPHDQSHRLLHLRQATRCLDTHTRWPAPLRGMQPAAHKVQQLPTDPAGQRNRAGRPALQSLLPKQPGILPPMLGLPFNRAVAPPRIVPEMRQPANAGQPAFRLHRCHSHPPPASP